MIRRRLLKLAGGVLCGALAALSFGLPAAAEEPKEIRIGYQKAGLFPAVKARKTLEEAFAAQGTTIKWVEFAFGPPILEAITH